MSSAEYNFNMKRILLAVFALWMTGPSAIGSLNGTPSSTISTPPSCIANKIGIVASGVGKPAVTKVTRAADPWTYHLWNEQTGRTRYIIPLHVLLQTLVLLLETLWFAGKQFSGLPGTKTESDSLLWSGARQIISHVRFSEEHRRKGNAKIPRAKRIPVRERSWYPTWPRNNFNCKNSVEIRSKFSNMEQKTPWSY